MNTRYYTYILFLIFTLNLWAQTGDIKFEHLSVEHGLSQNNIMCIMQDKHGYLWIGTHDGLNKYDGCRFTIYRHDPDDSLSISSNWITALFEDRTGVLWISTKGGGLNKFDREKEKFIRYKYTRNNPTGLSAITLEQIAEYQYGENRVLWIGTYNGLNKLDIATQKFSHYPHTKRSSPFGYVESLAVDSSGNVWVGSSADGLHKFNPETEKYTPYRHDPQNPASLSSNRIMSVYIDGSNKLWIGTNGGGLNKFDREKGQFIHYRHDPENSKSLSSDQIWSICEDRSNVLWIGTNDAGLNRFNQTTGEFTHYRHDPDKNYSLKTNSIRHIYEDNTGILWIGTMQGGLHKYNPQSMQFSLNRQTTSYPTHLINTSVSSIYEANHNGEHTLWIGTLGEGLYRLSRATDQIINFRHDPNNSNSLSSNVITHCLESTYKGRKELWIGTINGLNKYDLRTKKNTRYFHYATDPHSLSCNFIRTLFEDKNGILWIGTQTGGLHEFDRETQQFKRSGPRLAVTQIYEDRSGMLWLAVWPQLVKLDRATGKFFKYLRNAEASNFADLNRTNTIFESNFGDKDILWTGTFSGLNKFNRRTEKFINYTTKDGLPNNFINGIIEDKQGNLWLSTNKGLSKFNPNTNSFRNYDIYDGLLNDQYNFGTYFKNKDGEMYFGGTNGIDAFLPENIEDNPQIPRIVLTNFQIFNEPVPVKKGDNLEKNDIFYLPGHISTLKEIELSYEQNVFSLEFAALSYNSPQKNKYAYKMEGVDPNWVYTDASRRFVSYTQLDPGDYIFCVRGSNNDGIWNEAGTSLRIIITPPWWRTNFAYLSYILLFIAIVGAGWRNQTNRLKMKHQMEIDHLQTEKLEEVDRMKSRFFANISHEFRTPLTLIMGPVKQMLSGEFSGNMKQQFRMILRNSDRLLSLINQLLDLSKLESGRMKLRVVETDITQFIKNIVLSFSSLAESKKITLKYESFEESLPGYIDIDKLEKIITNLLSNACKFTPENGIIEVAMSLRGPDFSGPKQSHYNANNEIAASPPSSGNRNDRNLELSITNTGSGIPPNRLDKVFDRFYQADNNYKKDGEGSGIGLALTKEVVELHRGTIKVTSDMTHTVPEKKLSPQTLLDPEEVFQTTFTVLLPISRDSFGDDEIASETHNTESGSEYPASCILHPESGTQDPGARLQVPAPSAEYPVPTLLIVEDNPDVTTYVRSFLEEDYNIVTAENGKIGWQMVSEKYPDLIISDVMMPEMDGYELCKKIKSDENTSHIPVILLTAKADMASKIDGLEFGADDYISKPFDADELKVRSKNLIEQRKMLRDQYAKAVEIKPGEIAATSMDEQFLNRLLDVFENHVAESDFSTDDFAQEIGMSRSSLHRKLQALTNQPTHEFLRTLRIKRAAQLLEKSAGSVTEIAYRVGFNNPSHFAKIFRQHFGLTPSEFAEKMIRD